MGLSWHQGPLSPGAIGRFLVPEPLPKRLSDRIVAGQKMFHSAIEMMTGHSFFRTKGNIWVVQGKLMCLSATRLKP